MSFMEFMNKLMTFHILSLSSTPQFRHLQPLWHALSRTNITLINFFPKMIYVLFSFPHQNLNKVRNPLILIYLYYSCFVDKI